MEKEEQGFYFGGDREKAETIKRSPKDQPPEKRAAIALASALEKLREKPFRSKEQINNIAEKLVSLPGFIHLNPQLISVAMWFRQLTKNQALDSINPKTRDKKFNFVLTKEFINVKINTPKFLALKADLIRYLLLIEKVLK
jgi:hypothetical protein